MYINCLDISGLAQGKKSLLLFSNRRYNFCFGANFTCRDLASKEEKNNVNHQQA